MIIQLTYEIPRSNLNVFKHLLTNRLVVNADISTCYTVKDLKCEIADEILRNYGICLEKFDSNAIPGWNNILRRVQAEVCARQNSPEGGLLNLKYGSLVLYPANGTHKRWYLPVCAASNKGLWIRSKPSNLGLWEEVDLDGCPTICFTLTWDVIKCLNKAPNFKSFFAMLIECTGEGTMREFFLELWLKYHNALVIQRNQWEADHGIHTPSKNPYRGMSVRKAARLSV